MKRLALVTLVLMIMLITLPVGASLAQPSQPGVRVDVSASPSNVELGGEVEVLLTLVGNNEVCASEEIYRPLRVVLVVDRSGSMGSSISADDDQTKMQAAVDGVRSFLGLLDGQKDRAGLVSFAANSQLDASLSSPTLALTVLPDDDSGLNNAGTNIEAGLNEAYREIEDEVSDEVSAVIILLTDGVESDGSSVATAESIKDAGIRLVTIGLGPDTNEDLLRIMASTPGDYYFAPQSADLASIYESIAHHVKEFDPATDIEVKYQFDASNFSLVSDSVQPSDGKVESNQVVWTFSHLSGNQQQMRVRLRANSPGTYNTVQSVTLSYQRCGKEAVTESLPLDFPIAVGGGLNPVLCTDTPPPSTGNFLCDRIPWGWIIGGLALVISLLLWYLKYKDEIRDWFRCGIVPSNCFWARLLLALFLPVVIGVIANLAAGYLCAPRSGWMFWRINPDLSSAIYLQPTDISRPAQPVTPLASQTECIGCHVTSNGSQELASISGGTNGRLTRYSYLGEALEMGDIQGSYPAYSPDGKRIAYAANNEDIYIYDVQTGIAAPLEGASQDGIIESMPAWNADGSQIAFIRASGANQESTITTPCDILTVPSSGGLPTLVTGASMNGFNYHPAFSPDGKWLAFVHHESGSTTYGDSQAEIYLVPAGGGSPRRLAINDSPGGQRIPMGNTWPVWSKDGSTLYFSSRRCDDQNDIFKTNISPKGESSPADRMFALSDPAADEYGANEVQLEPPSLWDLVKTLLPWLIPLLLLLLLNWLLCRRKPTLTIDPLRIEYLPPDPLEGRLNRNQTFDVITELVGLELKEHRTAPQRVDAVLVVDCSGSMMGTKIARVQRAARRFVRCYMMPQERLGIVSFGSEAREVQPVTNSERDLVKAVNKLLPNLGGTDISRGINCARDSLLANARNRAEKVLVIFTDGQPTEDHQLVIDAATRAKQKDIRIIVVGTADANIELMRQVVDDEDDFLYVQEMQGIERAFLNISQKLLTPVSATGLVITQHYDDENFSLIADSVKPKPESLSPGEIIWNLAEIGLRPQEFAYQVNPRTAGNRDIVMDTLVNYLHGGSHERKSTGAGRGMNVVVKQSIQLAAARGVSPADLTAPAPVWNPDRTLIIGVGTSGRWILTHVMESFMNAGYGCLPDGIEFLAIDTDTASHLATQGVTFAGVELDPGDVFIIDENLDPVLDELAKVPRSVHAGWFRASEYLPIRAQVNLQAGTRGRRALSRVAFIRILQDPEHKSVNSQWRTARLAPGAAKQGADTPDTQVNLEGTIRSRCRRVLPPNGDKRIHIILVGSLHGGMSGILSDVAVLARNVANDVAGAAGTVRLESYLIDGNIASTFAGVAPFEQMERRANSYATLREMARLQMPTGVPQPMVWHAPLDSARYNLFDDMLVFSMSPDPQFAHAKYPAVTPPDMGTAYLKNFLYPSIADMITVRIDAAMNAAHVNDYFGAMRTATLAQINAKHEMMINAAGVYTIRIAVASILRSLHIRWVWEILRVFLSGEDEGVVNVHEPPANMELTWEWAAPSDPTNIMNLTPPELVDQFLGGNLDGKATEGSKALAEWLAMDNSSRLGSRELEDFLHLPEHIQKDGQGKRLGDLLVSILKEDAVGGRSGRIGFCLAFLNTLIEKMKASKETLSAAGYQDLGSYASITGRCAQDHKDALIRLRDAISCQQPGKNPGLWERVTRLSNEMQNLSAELDQIVNRKYLWGRTISQADSSVKYVEYRDEWWSQYLAGKMNLYLPALDWDLVINVDDTNHVIKYQLDLALHINENGIKTSVHLLRDGLAKFVEIFTRVAASMTVGAYEITLAGEFSNTMKEMLFTKEFAHRIGIISRPVCGAAAGIAGGAAIAPDQILVIHPDGVPVNLGWDQQFSTDVFTQATEGRHITTASDVRVGMNPTLIAYLQTRNSILMENLPGVVNGRHDYDLQDGFNPSMGRFDSHVISHRACFRAEGEARRLETQQNGTYPYRTEGPMHPLVVSGFNHPGRAELFLMAMAEGRICEDHGSILLHMPPGDTQLMLLSTSLTTMDPFVEAYLNWVYKISWEEEVEKQLAAYAAHFDFSNPKLDKPNLGNWLTAAQPPLNDGPADRKSLGNAVRGVLGSYNHLHKLRWDFTQDQLEQEG